LAREAPTPWHWSLPPGSCAVDLAASNPTISWSWSGAVTRKTLLAESPHGHGSARRVDREERRRRVRLPGFRLADAHAITASSIVSMLIILKPPVLGGSGRLLARRGPIPCSVWCSSTTLRRAAGRRREYGRLMGRGLHAHRWVLVLSLGALLAGCGGGAS